MRTQMRALVAAAVAALTIVGCTPGASAPGPATSGGASPAPAQTQTPPPAQTVGPAPAGSVSDWTSSPLVVDRDVPVPPVPRLIGIRSAAHSDVGYDRVTFDFESDLPGYDVRYVDQPVADGSGLPVSIPGRRYLQITFRPAQAHDDSGTQSVTPPSATLGYPMMQAYAITGDFEATLTVVLGLDDVVGFRVGELPGRPGRIYVDVAA